MKKLLALLMIVSTMFLIACNSPAEEDTEVSSDVPVTSEEDVEEKVVEEEKTEEKAEPPKEDPKSETPAPEAVTFNVAGNEFSFAPANFTAEVGQPVKIVFKNNGKAVHDLQVVGLGKTALTDPGQTGTVEFTPTSAGSYEMICTVPGHKELGMAGTLTVE